MYFILILRLIWIFSNTLYYILLSIIHPQKIPQIKQAWAKSSLNKLGYELQTTPTDSSLNWNDPLILVGNHISYLDILVVLAAHPQTVFLSKIEVKKWPIIGWGARRAGTLFVDRNSIKDRRALREQIFNKLQQTHTHLVIFPSGTTTLNEDIMWKKGAFEIAEACSIPIQTFKINYSPLRESAYIDDDQLLQQMLIQLKTKNKKAYFKWGDRYSITNAKIDMIDIKKNALEIRI